MIKKRPAAGRDLPCVSKGKDFVNQIVIGPARTEVYKMAVLAADEIAAVKGHKAKKFGFPLDVAKLAKPLDALFMCHHKDMISAISL